jgi:DNA end-binding protein Ku
MSEARSMANLTISFGLVAIPVRLYSATVSSERIHFNLLHRKDGSRLKQQYICALEGKVVDRSEMVTGYQFAKDQYVVFEPDEIKALEEAGSDAIEIGEFVPLESVDPVYFDTTYYLAPDRGGAKPYALLASALKDTDRCAIGRWAARGREYIVVIRSMGKGLVMHQLHFQAEVRSLSEIAIETAEIKEGELKLARQIIEQQAAAAFDPSSYVDEFRGRVEAAIQKKLKGKKISFAERPAARSAGNVVDIMEMLRASLETEGVKGKGLKPKGPKRASPASSRRSARA